MDDVRKAARNVADRQSGARRRAEGGLVATYIRELANGTGRTGRTRRPRRVATLTRQPWPCNSEA
jgi:hypothetical protein